MFGWPFGISGINIIYEPVNSLLVLPHISIALDEHNQSWYATEEYGGIFKGRVEVLDPRQLLHAVPEHYHITSVLLRLYTTVQSNLLDRLLDTPDKVSSMTFEVGPVQLPFGSFFCRQIRVGGELFTEGPCGLFHGSAGGNCDFEYVKGVAQKHEPNPIHIYYSVYATPDTIAVIAPNWDYKYISPMLSATCV